MMIKKYLIDGVAICAIALAAFLLAQQPVLDWRHDSAAISKPVGEEKAVAKDGNKKVSDPVASSSAREESPTYLKKRNIFSLDGSYTSSKAATPKAQDIPENPYTLMAILKGKERSALFREYTGTVVAATLHKKMLDGFVVTHISDLSVELKRGKEAKQMSVFTQLVAPDAKTTSAAAKEKASDGSYVLLGVLHGSGKAGAIIKDNAGNIITAKIGKKMDDGFILSSIDSTSVRFKRGNEIKELKLFDPSIYMAPPQEKSKAPASGNADVKKTGARNRTGVINDQGQTKPGGIR